jgi:1-phosphofructokinase family hexose kinase
MGANRALVLALNPSIDVEWSVDSVQWEEKNIIRAERRWPGGKGVNVARWLKFLGGSAKLLLPLGGATGRELADGLRREEISAKIISLREPTRANIIVTTKAGRQLRFNPVGPKLSRLEWEKIVRETKRELPKTSLLILSGSLPRGISTDAYAQLIRLAASHGVKTLLDCDGAAFAAGVKARPFLVKPNEHELAQWVKTKLRSEKQLRDAALRLSMKTKSWILLSRGRKGAWLVNARGKAFLSTKAPRIRVRNTVGAGDAMLAAVSAQIMSGASPKEWLRRGVETGSAAASCVAGKLPQLR